MLAMRYLFLGLILLLAGCAAQVQEGNNTTAMQNGNGSAMDNGSMMNGSTMENNSGMLAGNGTYEVTASDISYFGDAAGYLAKPKAPGAYPGVVMIHEWWGLNDNMKEMARSLASQGYAVLAVDLYHGSVATTPEEATALVSAVNETDAIANMQAAAAYLRENESAPKLASLGWCFGGGQSLQLAMSGEKLDATALYYGAPLVTNETRLSAIGWPVLGIFGDNDSVIPLENIRQFNSSLNSLGIENQIFVYPGLGHAFANPSGQTYAPNQTKDAWNKTLDFLEKNLR
jgi:carboxymethylenebutenolidase